MVSPRRRWIGRAAAMVLLAAALRIWAPSGAGLLVGVAHERVHDGELGSARAWLRAASCLSPSEPAIAAAIAALDREAHRPGGEPPAVGPDAAR